MELLDILPLRQGPAVRRARTSRAMSTITNDDKKAISKALKVSALALNFLGSSYTGDRANFEEPEYDFERISKAIDTDSYVKQAFRKYRDLFWKEGWELVSENPVAIDYLYKRFDFMEIAMGRSIQGFLAEAVDQLCKYSNVFIVKARDKKGVLNQMFPGPVYTPEGKYPFMGLYIIPTEKVEILRDKHNKPKKYRQRIDESISGYTATNPREPTWKAEDVIHLSLEKKPGRAFGTPLIDAALDDVIALRQIEEDIQNLVHRELFPLYKYKIGTDEHPAVEGEVDEAHAEIQALRSDGALVMPHRHDVDVIGAENKSLDAEGYLDHFKQRVAIGLGVFPHHLGMMSDGANKDMTDRLDIILFDRVKELQKVVEEAIRFNILNELLMEGGFNPYVNPNLEGPSDRVMFVFHEIDQDTKVKKEAHEMALMTAMVKTIPEARTSIHLPPEYDEEETIAALQARMTPDQPVQTKTGDGGSSQQIIDITPDAARKPDAQKSSKGGNPNTRNLKKGAGNVVRPSNQYGRRTSPNIRHNELPAWLKEVEDLLDDGV